MDAEFPAGLRNTYVGIVGLLGGIGFTMCLLLTEVSMPAKLTPIPKLAVLVSSAIASLSGAAVALPAPAQMTAACQEAGLPEGCTPR